MRCPGNVKELVVDIVLSARSGGIDGETDATVNVLALVARIVPIICVGETLQRAQRRKKKRSCLGKCVLHCMAWCHLRIV